MAQQEPVEWKAQLLRKQASKRTFDEKAKVIGSASGKGASG